MIGEKSRRSYDQYTVSLSEWLAFNSNTEEYRKLFIGMSSALKYIHENDYCVLSFNPRDIDILNDDFSQIRFNVLDKMPGDNSEKRMIIKQNVFDHAFLQIGVYTDCLNYLKESFLKSNFNDFVLFLPPDDVSYYRGVVERGASVYFVDYTAELQKRELASLEAELGAEGGASNSRSLVKSNGKSILADEKYDSIYKLNNSINEAAFVSFFVVPIVVAFLGIAFAIVAFIMGLF